MLSLFVMRIHDASVKWKTMTAEGNMLHSSRTKEQRLPEWSLFDTDGVDQWPLTHSIIAREKGLFSKLADSMYSIPEKVAPNGPPKVFAALSQSILETSRRSPSEAWTYRWRRHFFHDHRVLIHWFKSSDRWRFVLCAIRLQIRSSTTTGTVHAAFPSCVVPDNVDKVINLIYYTVSWTTNTPIVWILTLCAQVIN